MCRLIHWITGENVGYPVVRPTVVHVDDLFHSAHRMIKLGDVIAMRHALEGGLDPNLTNCFGWTLLMLAALHGRSDFVQILMCAGADPARKKCSCRLVVGSAGGLWFTLVAISRDRYSHRMRSNHSLKPTAPFAK